MNGLFMTSPPRDPDLAVRALLEFAAGRGVPWSLTGRAELIEALKEVATAAGLKEYDSDVGMILDSLDCDEPPLPTGLVIERAEDLAGIQRCFLTIARGYGIPAAALVPLLNIKTVDAYLADPPMAFFIGYIDGKPVAASAGIAWEGVSYVFMVGTVPEFRRRGIGAAMTWRVVLDGRARGCTTSFLRSTQMGLPVYKRMGYREVNRYPSMTKPLVKGRKKVALILRFLWWNLWLAIMGPRPGK
jgi:GNAT superfamily N-acetyltransferase